MRSVLRHTLHLYLSRIPVTEGKGFLYRMFSERLLPQERDAVVSLAPGFRILLDLSVEGQREIYFFGTYERKESVLIRRILRRGDVFWDIGANVGFYALLAATCVGREGRVVAFEPFPPAWERLRENVLLNSFGQISCVNAAVSSAAGTARLFFEGDGPDGGASLAPEAGQTSCVASATVTLDGFLAEGGERPPTVMKADVEGAEKDVLTGTGVTLGEDPTHAAPGDEGAALHAARPSQGRDPGAVVASGIRGLRTGGPGLDALPRCPPGAGQERFLDEAIRGNAPHTSGACRTRRRRQAMTTARRTLETPRVADHMVRCRREARAGEPTVDGGLPT